MLPRLQRLTDNRRAALLIGFVHGLLHLPLILIGSTYDVRRGRFALGSLPQRGLTITAGGVFYGWVRDRSGSLWPVRRLGALNPGTSPPPSQPCRARR